MPHPLARVRIDAAKRWPHATSAILSMVPVETPGLGTCAVDKFWRIYYDPEFLAKCQNEEAVGVILHEVSHLLLKHAGRAKTIVPANDPAAHFTWNCATDCSINDALKRDHVKLPAGVLYPEQFKLPGNQAAEFYYPRLKDQLKDQLQQCPAGPSANDGIPGTPGRCFAPQAPGTSGSCSDGKQRPWEHGPPPSEEDASQQAAAGQTPVPPGLLPHEQDQIVQHVAENIKQRGFGKGTIWAGFVENILNPKVDPKALLMRAVRKGVERVTGGCDEWSYRRPSRRQSQGGMLRPSGESIIPRITVIVDSSGSMGNQDLGLAVGLIAKVLSGLRLRDGVHVIVGDTAVQTATKVFDPKKVAIVGRGGTDVGAIIRQAYDSSKPKPDVIVAVTDGETPWPRNPLPIPVVACLTRAVTHSQRPPAWIQTVVIAPH